MTPRRPEVAVLALVVEDDAALRSSLERALRFEGYQVVSVADGAAALAAVREQRPDVVVLDLGLPRLDGVEVCRRLRRDGDDVPVLMLTARATTPARVLGLDAGADDYLAKPFALEELLARLRALVRRAGLVEAARRVVVAGDLSVDLDARRALRAGRWLDLTRTEFDLIAVLAAHPRHVLSRAQLLDLVWGEDADPGSNAVDVYVGYLRRKTEAAGEERIVHTVRGVGYVLRPVEPGRART